MPFWLLIVPAVFAIDCREETQRTRQIVSSLYNLVENIVSENTTLTEENQALKDEVNKLKGEQGKSVIKPDKKKMVIFLGLGPNIGHLGVGSGFRY